MRENRTYGFTYGFTYGLMRRGWASPSLSLYRRSCSRCEGTGECNSNANSYVTIGDILGRKKMKSYLLKLIRCTTISCFEPVVLSFSPKPAYNSSAHSLSADFCKHVIITKAGFKYRGNRFRFLTSYGMETWEARRWKANSNS